MSDPGIKHLFILVQHAALKKSKKKYLNCEIGFIHRSQRVSKRAVHVYLVESMAFFGVLPQQNPVYLENLHNLKD